MGKVARWLAGFGGKEGDEQRETEALTRKAQADVWKTAIHRFDEIRHGRPAVISEGTVTTTTDDRKKRHEAETV